MKIDEDINIIRKLAAEGDPQAAIELHKLHGQPDPKWAVSDPLS